MRLWNPWVKDKIFFFKQVVDYGKIIKMEGEFLEIFKKILFSITLSTASFLVGIRHPDSEKVSVYECGFDPSRTPFSVTTQLLGQNPNFWQPWILRLWPKWCTVSNEISTYSTLTTIQAKLSQAHKHTSLIPRLLVF